MKIKNILLIYVLFSSISASTGSLGEDLPLFSIIPFIGILLSIAVVPLVAPMFWHHNFGKLSAFWAISFLIPFILWRGFDEALHQFLHVILLEYIPFILLLLALFTISGGIRLKGYLAGTPKVNTLILFIGTALASWMGTTGAAMLLIRPILRSNKNRKNKVHTIIFFIFLVANIGGSLTPLGDPPLFLGFLHGINFFWTAKALFLPMLVSSLILLSVYFLLDTYYCKKEKYTVKVDEYKEPLSIDGKGNFILLGGVLRAVSSNQICISLILLASSSLNFNENQGNEGDVNVPCRLAAKR